MHECGTKLDYRHRCKGPGQVLHKVSSWILIQVVYIVESVVKHTKHLPVHLYRLRRFVSDNLEVTEQIRTDIVRRHHQCYFQTD